MKNSIIFWFLTILFFIIYFNVLMDLWNFFLPWNLYTDIVAVFVVIFVNIPLSVYSAEKLIKAIKSDKF